MKLLYANYVKLLYANYVNYFSHKLSFGPMGHFAFENDEPS